jgi:hypothetical protein
MNHKLAVVLVLCLSVAALLGIAAAPAAAQDGCDCHTLVPPTNGAPAAHAPYVASVTECTACHADWTGPPHPDVGKGLRLGLRGRSTDTSYQLDGLLRISVAIVPFHPGHPGVVVYLQQRLWGATEFTDLTQVTTGAKGGYTFTVASPPPYATYRAIAQGHLGPLVGGSTGLYLPKRTTLLPKPNLTLYTRGFTPGRPWTPTTVKVGRTLTVHGAVAPADLGGKVTIRVQKRNAAGHWVLWVSVKRAFSSTGTYSWKWTPRYRGEYRVDGRIPATAAHRGVVRRWPSGGLTIIVY